MEPEGMASNLLAMASNLLGDLTCCPIDSINFYHRWFLPRGACRTREALPEMPPEACRAGDQEKAGEGREACGSQKAERAGLGSSLRQ